VLIMYLWAALFSVTVVSLSVVRSRLVVLEAATAVAVLTLLPVTMPRLRPWRLLGRGQAVPAVSRPGTAAPAARRATPPAAPRPSSGGSPFPPAPLPDAASFPGGPLPRAGRLPEANPVNPFASAYPGHGRLSPPDPFADGTPYPGPGGPAPAAGPAENSDPLAQPRHRDARPW